MVGMPHAKLHMEQGGMEGGTGGHPMPRSLAETQEEQPLCLPVPALWTTVPSRLCKLALRTGRSATLALGPRFDPPPRSGKADTRTEEAPRKPIVARNRVRKRTPSALAHPAIQRAAVGS